MTGPAALPMYDMPGIHDHNVRLWQAIRDNLRSHQIAAPDTLTQDVDAFELWRDPNLCLSQTCGLPLVSGLVGDATVLGAFDYGLDDCEAGQYFSVIVAGKHVPETPRFAYNDSGSQSGYAALKRHMGPRLGAGVKTGSHVASVRAVAEGHADIAAIDAVTWRLALAYEPAAKQLHVVDRTTPTPGLPLITAPGRDPAPFRAALATAAAAAGLSDTPLGIRGFRSLDRSDYEAAIWPVD